MKKKQPFNGSNKPKEVPLTELDTNDDFDLGGGEEYTEKDYSDDIEEINFDKKGKKRRSILDEE